MGYRRGIKPDVLAPGGRVVVSGSLTTALGVLDVYDQSRSPGQRVASPGTDPGDLRSTRYMRGTSGAAALISRAGGLLHEVVAELRREPGGRVIEDVPLAVWIKALIVHGAEWGAAGPALTRILRNRSNSRQFKEYVTRLLGYGAVDIGRVRECTARRVTVLSGGTLKRDSSRCHRFPLPSTLSGKAGYRRLTVTLAWLSPVNARHQAWRRADLWFVPPKDPLRVDRQQADHRAVQRGTVQHEILEGERAEVFVDGANLEIQVSCRADAGVLEDEVPYALVTTLEVAEELDIDIYEDVRAAVYAVQVRTEAGA